MSKSKYRETLQTMYSKMFLNLSGVPPEQPLCAHQKMDHPKWTPKSSPGDRTNHACSHLFVAFFFLRDRLGGRPRRGLHFQNIQYRIGFIHVVDALIESMLDHRTVTPKSKNDRHTAWERSSERRNERHAAWERFSCFHGPVRSLKELPRRSRQTFVFKSLFANFALRDPLGGRSGLALHFEKPGG